MINLDSTYNKYKDRLFKHFISLNDTLYLKGTNIPASKRYVANSNVIQFGDTTIHLAYYIAFLATDYYLSKNKITLDYLKNALSALNRLDLYSKDTLLKNSGVYLNGFFLREDITNKQLYSSDCQNLLNPETFDNKIIHEKNIDSVLDDRSTLPVTDLNKNIERNVMSQDQFWHLFYGLGITKYLINDYDVNLMIDDIIDRFLKYTLKHCNQVIKNPITEKKVPRGANMMLFAYGFAHVGDKITGYYSMYKNMLYWWNKPLYKLTVFVAEIFYKFANIFNIPTKDYSYRALGCIGNIWSKNNNYIKNLIKDFEYKDRFPHFVLTHKILHKSDISNFNKEKLEQILMSIPKDGKLCVLKNSEIHKYWCTDSYLFDPEIKPLENKWNQGSFNGIDFLLLYNLYKIVYG